MIDIDKYIHQTISVSTTDNRNIFGEVVGFTPYYDSDIDENELEVLQTNGIVELVSESDIKEISIK